MTLRPVHVGVSGFLEVCFKMIVELAHRYVCFGTGKTPVTRQSGLGLGPGNTVLVLLLSFFFAVGLFLRFSFFAFFFSFLIVLT